MSTLVECVPNFSEGRNKAVVDAIVDAMKIPGVSLLDREMDSDHNRCVITIVGEREAITEAAIRGVGKASELIDLTKHQGAHPRMGAADVIPFIPIEGVTIEDCVAIARTVGEEIWKRFQIPVYLYESAATHPDRQNLENIRRGQFEGLREDVKVNPARKMEVRIDLAAAEATQAVLTVTYAVRGARWVPLYDARLDSGAKDRKPALELVRRAEIVQQTGEDWGDGGGESGA